MTCSIQRHLRMYKMNSTRMRKLISCSRIYKKNRNGRTSRFHIRFRKRFQGHKRFRKKPQILSSKVFFSQKSMNDLKFRFYKVFSKSKLHNHHKLIYGIILLESLDENLNDLGNFIIREYFQTCAQNQSIFFLISVNDFFEFIELLDPHFKYYIISVISLIPDLTNINRPSYTQFVRNMSIFLI